MQFARYRSLLHHKLFADSNNLILKAGDYPIIVEGVNVSNPWKDTLRISLQLIRHEHLHQENSHNKQKFTTNTGRTYEDGSQEVVAGSFLAQESFLKGHDKENLVASMRVFLEPKDELYCFSRGYNSSFDCSVHYIEIENPPKVI